ncbi:hypothetical protein [Runella sp. SP2]|nr:hypothetical protein [Runella sp. SP2]
MSIRTHIVQVVAHNLPISPILFGYEYPNARCAGGCSQPPDLVDFVRI